MDASLNPQLTRLRMDDVRSLVGDRGRGMAVFQGQIWLTQDCDPRDVILNAGDSFAFDRRGKVVVEALTDASVFLFDSADVDDTRDAGFAAATLRAAASLRTA